MLYTVCAKHFLKLLEKLRWKRERFFYSVCTLGMCSALFTITHIQCALIMALNKHED